MEMVFTPLESDGYIMASTPGSTLDGGLMIAGRLTPLGPPGTIARMVMAFDLSALPPLATVTGATLTLARVSSTVVDTPTYQCCGLTVPNWNEPSSWNSPWATAGGDYDLVNADSTVYGGSGALVFDGLGPLVSSRVLLDELVGLIVLGPEDAGPSNHFVASSSSGATAPTLTVEYTLAEAGCVTASAAVLKWTATATVEGCSRRDIMGYEVFELGSVPKVPVTFRTAAGAAMDPDAVHVTITKPDGTSETYTYETDDEVVRTGLGLYEFAVDLDQAGLWKARWWSEGDGKAAVTMKLKAITP